MMLSNEYWCIYRAAYQHDILSNSQIDQIKALYHNAGKDEIYNAAVKKKLVPAVANLFTKLEYDLDFWAPIVDHYSRRNNQVIQCLSDFFMLLKNNGIEKIVVVENFGALLASTQNISMFGSGDVDMYAPISEKDHICKILKENGYSFNDVTAGSIVISTGIRKDTLPDGFYFGINWDLTNRVNLPSYTTNGDFIEWGKCAYYKDTGIRLPSPEGLMYVCLLHIAVHGFCKAPDIRLYYDIANVADQNVDWKVIENWAIRDCHCVKVAVGSYLSRKLLGVLIPNYIESVGNFNQKKRLLRTVYSENENRLLDFPRPWRRFLIDVYSNDDGFCKGIKDVMFPNRRWIYARYSSGLYGYLKHLVNLI